MVKSVPVFFGEGEGHFKGSLNLLFLVGVVVVVVVVGVVVVVVVAS